MRVEVVRNVAGMAPHREAYQALWERVGRPELLYSHLDYLGILEPRLRRRGPLLFVLIYDELGLAAAAPLQIIRRSAAGLFSRLLTPVGVSDEVFTNVYPSILLRPVPAEEERLLAAITGACVGPLRHAWDELLWAGCSQQPVTEALERALPGLQRRAATQCYRCSTEQGVERYTSKLSKKLRKNIRRGRRQLEERYDPHFSCVHELSDALFEELAELHSRRQAAKRAQGAAHRFSLFDEDQDRQTLRRLLRWAEREGRLRLFGLRVGGRLAAFDLGVRHEGVIQLLLGTFDMEYARYSPSALLTVFSIDHEQRVGGVHMLDSLADGNAYKERMLPERVERWDLVGVNPVSRRGQLRWWFNQLREQISAEPQRVPGLPWVLSRAAWLRRRGRISAE